MSTEKTVFNAVGHIEINVSDLKRSAAFYKGIFGWSITPALPGYWMWRDKGKMGGGLSLVPKSKIRAGSVVFYVAVRDIGATLKKAKSLGGKVVSTKRKIEGGEWGFCGEMKDPSGNLVGLWSPK